MTPTSLYETRSQNQKQLFTSFDFAGLCEQTVLVHVRGFLRTNHDNRERRASHHDIDRTNHDARVYGVQATTTSTKPTTTTTDALNYRKDDSDSFAAAGKLNSALAVVAALSLGRCW